MTVLIKPEERMKLIEDGLKQFPQLDDFRKLITWLLVEQETCIYHALREKIERELNENEIIPIDDSKLIILGWVLSLLEKKP